MWSPGPWVRGRQCRGVATLSGSPGPLHPWAARGAAQQTCGLGGGATASPPPRIVHRPFTGNGSSLSPARWDSRPGPPSEPGPGRPRPRGAWRPHGPRSPRTVPTAAADGGGHGDVDTGVAGDSPRGAGRASLRPSLQPGRFLRPGLPTPPPPPAGAAPRRWRRDGADGPPQPGPTGPVGPELSAGVYVRVRPGPGWRLQTSLGWRRGGGGGSPPGWRGPGWCGGTGGWVKAPPPAPTAPPQRVP